MTTPINPSGMIIRVIRDFRIGFNLRKVLQAELWQTQHRLGDCDKLGRIEHHHRVL
jgi:hypothetical protein